MFRLILFSTETIQPGETELINQLMQLGDFNFHLRKKDAELRELKKFLLRISPGHHSRVILHQQYPLANDFSIGGIHLPERDRNQYESLKAEGHRIVSTSIHMLNDYEELRKKYAYIFFSPVFHSISKANYQPAQSFEELKEKTAQMSDISKLIALGGIDQTNIQSVMEAGFGGAAVLGSVWSNKNPVKYFQELLRFSGNESR